MTTFQDVLGMILDAMPATPAAGGMPASNAPAPGPGMMPVNVGFNPFATGPGLGNSGPLAGNSQLAPFNPANPGATAIPGHLGAVPNLASAVGSSAAPYAGMDGNQARAIALMQPPYNMSPGQVGLIRSQAESRANTAAAVQKGLIGAASLASDGLPEGIAMAGPKALSRTIDTLDSALDPLSDARRQQMANDLYGRGLNASLALPLQSSILDPRIRGFLPH